MAASSGLPVLYLRTSTKLTFTFQCFQLLFLSLFFLSFIDSKLTLLLLTTRSDGAYSTQDDEKEDNDGEMGAATPTNAELSANADQKATNAGCSNSYNPSSPSHRNPINQDENKLQAQGHENEQSSGRDWSEDEPQFEQNVIHSDVKEQTDEPENDQIREAKYPDEIIVQNLNSESLNPENMVQKYTILENTHQEKTVQQTTIHENKPRENSIQGTSNQSKINQETLNQEKSSLPRIDTKNITNQTKHGTSVRSLSSSFNNTSRPMSNATSATSAGSGFLVSFIADARGGTTTSERAVGLKFIVPANTLSGPTRLCCRVARLFRKSDNSGLKSDARIKDSNKSNIQNGGYSYQNSYQNFQQNG